MLLVKGPKNAIGRNIFAPRTRSVGALSHLFGKEIEKMANFCHLLTGEQQIHANEVCFEQCLETTYRLANDVLIC